jgi:DNA-binding response OmpR family regulator
MSLGRVNDTCVLLVGAERDWPPELLPALDGDGYRTQRVPDLARVPAMLAGGNVRALFVLARPLGARDLLVLQRARDDWPGTAIVVVTRKPNDPDVKRAFESGATAFLSWPASAQAVRHAIDSGGLVARA